MRRLFAPWRMAYVAGKRQKTCIFCQGALGKMPRQVFLKTPHTLAMLNIYPYNNGHVMLAPLRHTRDIGSLKDAELLDLGKALIRVKRCLDKTLKPHGYNIGANLAADAGAGITGHLHIHLVPRWRGDTNFMPVVAGTKIISQSLKDVHALLKKEISSNIHHGQRKSNKKIRR